MWFLGNKWSSKDGFYTLNIHVYKGILFNRTQNEPQLLLIKANFSKAEWLNNFSLFPPLCSLLLEQSWFGLGDLGWPRHRRRHLCLRGLLCGCLQPPGKHGVVCSEGTDHAPGESGHDVYTFQCHKPLRSNHLLQPPLVYSLAKCLLWVLLARRFSDPLACHLLLIFSCLLGTFPSDMGTMQTPRELRFTQLSLSSLLWTQVCFGTTGSLLWFHSPRILFVYRISRLTWGLLDILLYYTSWGRGDKWASLIFILLHHFPLPVPSMAMVERGHDRKPSHIICLLSWFLAFCFWALLVMCTVKVLESRSQEENRFLPEESGSFQIMALGFHFATSTASVYFFKNRIRYCVLCFRLFKAKKGTG